MGGGNKHVKKKPRLLCFSMLSCSYGKGSGNLFSGPFVLLLCVVVLILYSGNLYRPGQVGFVSICLQIRTELAH